MKSYIILFLFTITISLKTKFHGMHGMRGGPFSNEGKGPHGHGPHGPHGHDPFGPRPDKEEIMEEPFSEEVLGSFVAEEFPEFIYFEQNEEIIDFPEYMPEEVYEKKFEDFYEMKIPEFFLDELKDLINEEKTLSEFVHNVEHYYDELPEEKKKEILDMIEQNDIEPTQEEPTDMEPPHMEPPHMGPPHMGGAVGMNGPNNMGGNNFMMGPRDDRRMNRGPGGMGPNAMGRPGRGRF